MTRMTKNNCVTYMDNFFKRMERYEQACQLMTLLDLPMTKDNMHIDIISLYDILSDKNKLKTLMFKLKYRFLL